MAQGLGLTVTPGARPLSHGHPDLARRALQSYEQILGSAPDPDARGDPSADKLMARLERIMGARTISDVLVLGCGPRPVAVASLLGKRFNAVGVEPVIQFVNAANRFLSSSRSVLEGSAEAIPVPDHSMDVVICESLLEHVDSPVISLHEIHRVLRPGGVLFATTTNRHRLSVTGANGEYNVRFFNWLPNLVKESYVFRHLHHDPSLANYSLRPAVHWFTYDELCVLGRQCGFHQFYSLIDVLEPDDATVASRVTRRMLLKRIQRNAWLRALTLTQLGGTIFMLKREEAR